MFVDSYKTANMREEERQRGSLYIAIIRKHLNGINHGKNRIQVSTS
jgi:hypothetical protein